MRECTFRPKTSWRFTGLSRSASALQSLPDSSHTAKSGSKGKGFAASRGQEGLVRKAGKPKQERPPHRSITADEALKR